jgi:hypothetical protein
MRPLRVNEVQVLALVLHVTMDDLLTAPITGELGDLQRRYDGLCNEVLQAQVELNLFGAMTETIDKRMAVDRRVKAELDAKVAAATTQYQALKEQLTETRLSLTEAHRIDGLQRSGVK